MAYGHMGSFMWAGLIARSISAREDKQIALPGRWRFVNSVCDMSSSSKQAMGAPPSFIVPSPKPSVLTIPHLPLSTVLQQCNHLIQLQDALLQNSIKHWEEVTDQNRAQREEFSELCGQLEVL